MKTIIKTHWKKATIAAVLIGSLGWNAWIYTAVYMIQLQQAAAQNATNSVFAQITDGIAKTGAFVIAKQGKDGATSTMTLVEKRGVK